MNLSFSETELCSVLQNVLVGVCTRCDFVHGEALRPSGNSCLVQSGASYCGSTGAADFHRASLNFYFPPNVSLAGRVWKFGCTEWHDDVSILPSTIFLRAELAHQTELKTALAMPLCKDSRVLAVCIFYSRFVIASNPQLEKTCLALANEVLASTYARGHIDPSLCFVAGDPSNVEQPASKSAQSKAWQRCQQSLDVSPEERSEEQLEQIIKYSKGVQFFKYITNQQRSDLCKTMTYTRLLKNQLVMHGNDVESQEPSNVWHVVVSGRVDMCVRTQTEGKTYRMCGFKEGDTFAASYMKMFSTQTSIVTHIEATSDAVCILITIPEEYKEEFRTCTRPLWYEELAQYFHMSINEAAESLGMCMSAIKKICRRHGISRWPHRKLASVNKTVAMLQSKINKAQDEQSGAALRSEAVNVLTMKLRLTINPAYLVRDEAVLLPSMGQPGAMGQSFSSTQPRVFGGEGEDPGMGGFGIAGRGEMVGMDGRGYPHNVMQRNTLLAAQAQAEAQAAAANAANVLQNVSLPLHNIARAGGREGPPGMGMMGYPVGKQGMEMGMGMGMGMGIDMQQRLMLANQQQQQQQQQHRPGGGMQQSPVWSGLRQKQEEEGSGSAFDSTEDSEGRTGGGQQQNKQQRNIAVNAGASMQGGAGGGNTVGIQPFYGMGPGQHLQPLAGYSQGHMGGAFPGWQGAAGMPGQLGSDALLQPRPLQSFGGYSMGGTLQGFPGGPPGMQAQVGDKRSVPGSILSSTTGGAAVFGGVDNEGSNKRPRVL